MLKLGTSTGVEVFRHASAVFDYVSSYSAVNNYFDALAEKPTNPEAAALDNLYDALFSAALIPKLEVFCVHANSSEQAARMNLINAVEATQAGAFTFEKNRYLKGDGASAFLDWNIAATATSGYSQNSGSLGAYVFDGTIPPSGSYSPVGWRDNQNAIRVSLAGQFFGAINSNGISYAGPLVDGFTNLLVASRTGATTIKLFLDDAEVASGTTASVAEKTTTELRSFEGWNATGAMLCPWKLGCTFMGSGLTLANVQAMKAALDDYFIAIGAL